MLTTPLLSPIISFDATKSYDVIFNVIGGNQVIKNNIVILRNSDNLEVYNQTIESFQFKHTLPANTLTNTVTYKIKIRTSDIYNNWSEFTSYTLFTCYQPADVSITNLTGGIANNQNYTFVGSYVSHGDDIKSYLFILYDENGVELDISPLVYYSTTSTIEAQFILQNQTNYKIELKTYSQNGVTVSSGLIPFMAVYLAPTMGAEIQLTNLSDQGAVEIELIAIDRELTGSNYTFESDNWVNLTAAGAIIRLTEGLDTIKNNYSLRLHFKNIIPDVKFLKILSTYGSIEILYTENRFHAWQKAMGLVSHFISDEITVVPTDMICLEIKIINGLIDLIADYYI